MGKTKTLSPGAACNGRPRSYTKSPKQGSFVSSLTKSSPSSLFKCYAFVAAILVSMEMVPTVVADVRLPQFNRSFESMPGLFGGKLRTDDPSVLAHLTLIPNQPFLCPDELKHIQPGSRFYNTNNNNRGRENTSNKNNITNPLSLNVTTTKNGGSNGSDNASNSNSDDGDDDSEFSYDKIEQFQVPEDGLPIAVLVERGMCTFYEKALMASKYGQAIQYIIVYDDEVSTDLVPMSSEFTTNITLLFVSSLSGQEIRNFIVRNFITEGRNSDMNETEASDEIGIFVEIDGVSPIINTPYPALNMAAYFLAAMSGFLAFLIFFGCILICAQFGWITAAPDEHGRIVLFAGGPGIRITDGVRMIRNSLLTQEQVMKLDEEEYEEQSTTLDGDGNKGENERCCCAICLDEFQPKEKVRILPCKHRFHEPCLIPWLTERHASCPLCKFDVLQHIIEKEKNNDDDDDENKTDKSDRGTFIEAGDESEERITRNRNGEVSSLPSSRASSPVRSVWHRLRGWTLVSTDVSQDNTIDSDGDGSQGESVSLGRTSISEIEMENRRIVIVEENQNQNP